MDDAIASDEGKRRFPPDGVYDELWVCTCKPECPSDCKGECGCEAHAAAWGEYLNSQMNLI